MPEPMPEWLTASSSRASFLDAIGYRYDIASDAAERFADLGLDGGPLGFEMDWALGSHRCGGPTGSRDIAVQSHSHATHRARHCDTGGYCPWAIEYPAWPSYILRGWKSVTWNFSAMRLKSETVLDWPRTPIMLVSRTWKRAR